MRNVTQFTLHSLIYLDERDIDRAVSSLFTPRECRFLLYYFSRDMRREDPFELFEEHIPYTRRSFLHIKAHELKSRIHDSRWATFLRSVTRISKTYPQPPLHRIEVDVLWRRGK